jgi:UDP-N-acetyl-D-glucosamine dehydrogenase
VHSTSEVTRGSDKTATVGPEEVGPKEVDADDRRAKLEEALRNKTAKIGVIGLGYVGLPLVRTFVGAGLQTLGFDVDQSKVDSLQAGKSYIEHISSEWIQQCVAGGKFRATADMRRLAEADVLLICVPTPLSPSRDPDLIYVEQTARQIAAHLRVGQLVILESTTYPGTTRDVVLPILEQTGLRLGKDFYLAFSPEREDPGNPDFTAGTIPKVVGGMDPASRDLAVALYRQGMPDVIPVSSCEVAEACKIVENTYRAVNIALVNELKMLFDRMGMDVWEVIEAAKTKPFGYQAFYPGPGLGGHCIPIDPFYLTWLARCCGTTTRFIELAGEINTGMPQYVVDRLTEALNAQGRAVRGSKICILGVAYKRDVDDARESPAFVIIELLQKRGAVVSYHDPHIPHLPRTRHFAVAMSSSPLTPEFLAGQDCALIVTDHSACDYEQVVRHAPLVIDTRNATRNVKQGREKIVKA